MGGIALLVLLLAGALMLYRCCKGGFRRQPARPIGATYGAQYPPQGPYPQGTGYVPQVSNFPLLRRLSDSLQNRASLRKRSFVLVSGAYNCRFDITIRWFRQGQAAYPPPGYNTGVYNANPPYPPPPGWESQPAVGVPAPKPV